jgi:uncharacterized protein (TIGR02611 family)
VQGVRQRRFRRNKSVIKRAVHLTYKMARRIAIAVVGSTVLLIGLVMLVTPGPALVVIPVGLAILSVEFTWARLWLKKVRETISEQAANSFARRAENHRSRADGGPPGSGR